MPLICENMDKVFELLEAQERTTVGLKDNRQDGWFDSWKRCGGIVEATDDGTRR